MKKLKKEQGITLVTLVITLIILVIILSITITVGIKSASNAAENKLISELDMVKNAVLQQYYKYTLTNNDNELIGVVVSSSDIESEMGISLKINTLPDNTENKYKYYKLIPVQLKEIGIKKSEHTYVVNYGTGEVINYTAQTTESGEILYTK